MRTQTLSLSGGEKRAVLGLFGFDTLGSENVPEPLPLLDAAAECGIFALDTGFPELGKNAVLRCAQLRQALRAADRRMRVIINVPLSDCHSPAGLRAALEGKLTLLGLDGADLCTFGPISLNLVNRLGKIGFSAFLEQAAADGLFSLAGIWVMDRPEVLREAAALSGRLSYIRADYTPLDYAQRPGSYGLTAAGNSGLELLLSGFSLDGRIERSVPPEVGRLWESAGRSITLAEQLLRWTVQSIPGAFYILPAKSPRELFAMSSTVEEAEAGIMSVRDKLLCNNLRDACKAARPAACTACGCCMPCPAGLDIPGVIELYNDALTYGEKAIPAALYRLLGHDAASCLMCGKCSGLCPKKHPIPQIMSSRRAWLNA